MRAELARLARQIHRLRRETRTLARASQAAFRGVDLSDGPLPFYDENGEVALQIGQQDDGTVAIVETTTDSPPVPTPPDVEERAGALAIIHDGTFEDDNPPANLAYFEIHASQTPDYFADDSTQIGTFASPQGGTFTFLTDYDAGYWYISVQAVNTAGVESDKSAEVSGRAQGFATGDGNHIFIGGQPPSGGVYTENDVWYNENDGRRPWYWDATSNSWKPISSEVADLSLTVQKFKTNTHMLY